MLCVPKWSEALKRDDERAIDRAHSDLQDTLYELNREVRLQFEDEEDDFFGAIRRTFTGEREESLYPRREEYRDPYRRNDYREDYGYQEDYGDRNRNDYGSGSYYNEPSSRSRPRTAPEPERRPRSDRTRNLPYENDWDEEDDEWF